MSEKNERKLSTGEKAWYFIASYVLVFSFGMFVARLVDGGGAWFLIPEAGAFVIVGLVGLYGAGANREFKRWEAENEDR